jgi:hypothetical protein
VSSVYEDNKNYSSSKKKRIQNSLRREMFKRYSQPARSISADSTNYGSKRFENIQIYI